MRKGLVHIYTGNGKGKTSAALGLTLRALGQGLRVGIFQFLKKGTFDSGELKSAGKLGPNFRIVRFEEFRPEPVPAAGPKKTETGKLEFEDRKALRIKVGDDFTSVEKIMRQGKFDVVVLDEIITAVGVGLLNNARLIDLIRKKPSPVELVLTGRGRLTKALKDSADYVTRMQEIKHPFRRGLRARRGIEY